MRNKKLVIIGVAILLIGVVAFIIVIQRPRAVVTQSTVYLGVFDVTFESEEQIDAFISDSLWTAERQGTVLLGDWEDSRAQAVSWFVRDEDSPTMRLHHFPSRELGDRQVADASAVELVAYLVANNIEGVLSAEPVPIVECVWEGRGGSRWGEWYFNDMLFVPTTDLEAVRPGKARYQLLDTTQPIDCWDAFDKHRRFTESRILDSPVPARVPRDDLEPSPLPEFLRN